MGLAASQSRLIMLTLRQSDVEASLMHISMEKMDLSRQSAAASQEYENSLNTQKLVWSQNGSNSDIDYGTIMSTINPTSTASYLVADSSGHIVLSGGDNSLKIKAANVNTTTSALTETEADFLNANGAPTTSPSGTTQPQGSTQTTPITFVTNYNDADVFSELKKNTYKFTTNEWQNTGTDHPGNTSTYSNYFNGDQSGQVVNVYTLATGEKIGDSAVQTAVLDCVNGVSDDVGAAVIQVLQDKGGVDSDLLEKLKTAAGKAKEDTATFYTNECSSYAVLGSDVDSFGARASSSTKDKGSNQLIVDYCGYWTVKLDISQVVKTFLNCFDGECARLAGGMSEDDIKKKYFDQNRYNATKSGTDRNSTNLVDLEDGNNVKYASKRDNHGGTYDDYDTTTKNTYATTLGAHSTKAGGNGGGGNTTANATDQQKYDFYHSLYGILQQTGVTIDPSVTDRPTLQHKLMTGEWHLLKLSGGTVSNVSAGDSGGPLEYVADQDAINKAEAKYNTFKAQIDWKEKMLDVDSNNLSAEDSAIKTEKESVNKLIQDNIKVFNLFQAKG